MVLLLIVIISVIIDYIIIISFILIVINNIIIIITTISDLTQLSSFALFLSTSFQVYLQRCLYPRRSISTAILASFAWCIYIYLIVLIVSWPKAVIYVVPFLVLNQDFIFSSILSSLRRRQLRSGQQRFLPLRIQVCPVIHVVYTFMGTDGLLNKHPFSLRYTYCIYLLNVQEVPFSYEILRSILRWLISSAYISCPYIRTIIIRLSHISTIGSSAIPSLWKLYIAFQPTADPLPVNCHQSPTQCPFILSEFYSAWVPGSPLGGSIPDPRKPPQYNRALLFHFVHLVLHVIVFICIVSISIICIIIYLILEFYSLKCVVIVIYNIIIVTILVIVIIIIIGQHRPRRHYWKQTHFSSAQSRCPIGLFPYFVLAFSRASCFYFSYLFSCTFPQLGYIGSISTHAFLSYHATYVV